MRPIASTMAVLILLLVSAACGGSSTQTHRDDVRLAAGRDAVTGAEGAGCGPFEGVDSPPGSGDPIQPRSGWPIKVPLATLSNMSAVDAPTSFAVLQPLASFDGVDLQASLLEGAGDDISVISVYAPTPLTSTETVVDLLSRGGISFIQRRAAGQDAALVVETVGSRASTVRIGPYVGALVHADPMPTRSRTWNLYWSDGIRDMSIEGNVSSGTVIALARSLYCDGS